MPDELPADTPPPNYALQTTLRKLGFTLGVLLAAWLLVTQAAPYYFFPKASAPVVNQTPSAPPVPDETPPSEDRLAQLDARIESLENKLKLLEESTPIQAAPADQTRMETLEATIAGLKEQVAAQSHLAGDLTAVTAFSQLKDAIARGDGFALPLERLEDAFADVPEKRALFAPLAPFAETGLPTLAVLQKSFEKTIPALLYKEEPGSVFSLIRIRKVGEQQQGASDEAVIARAEAKLKSGNVGNCLKELEALSPAAAADAETWMKNAADYLAAQEALQAIERALIDSPAAARE
jgi:hypothetical protein